MRLAIVILVFCSSTGCTATHLVDLRSDPSGAHIHINGEWIGRTPLKYRFDSPFAEAVWPQDSRVTISMPGYTDETQFFRASSKLPKTVMFALDQIPANPWRGRKVLKETIEFEYQGDTVIKRKVTLEYEDAEGGGTFEREIMPPH